MSKGLCLYSFEVLNHQLTGDPVIPLSEILLSVEESMASFPEKAPLFVTWEKDDNLRGCIGTFQSQPIELGIERFSISASMQDPRFPPISLKEFPRLSCDVTLLSNFTPISDSFDWQIGKHGLKVAFERHGVSYSGTFLPSVAEDQQWDQLTTLWYLIRKADYSVNKSDIKLFYSQGLQQGWLNLETYEGVKYCVDYQQYKQWKTIIGSS